MKYVVDIGVGGEPVEVELTRSEGRTWAVGCVKRLPVELERLRNGNLYALAVGDRRITLWMAKRNGRVAIQWEGRLYELEIEPAHIRALRRHLKRRVAGRSSKEEVTSIMPGVVVKVEVAEGQGVKAGDGLVVIDAMKMENEIRAPCGGIVEKLMVEAGREVGHGQLLCIIRPDGPREGSGDELSG